MEDIALHLDRQFGYAPKSVANAIVDGWRQTLVIRMVSCFFSWHSIGLSGCGVLVWLGDLENQFGHHGGVSLCLGASVQDPC